MTLRDHLSRNFQNVPGWRTNRNIIVFESDDWGAVRVSSKSAYDWFLKNGYPVDKCPYNSNDALETNDDLTHLFETLRQVSDSNGRSAVFTANNVVCNPDFERIKADNFANYYSEVFFETLRKKPDCSEVFNLYQQGIEENIFVPQFHAREHVNVANWMQALRSEDRVARDAFRLNMFSVFTGVNSSCSSEYLDAFGWQRTHEAQDWTSVVSDGLATFKKLWGFHSESFIAPCYIWNRGIEPLLAKHDVRFLQGMIFQREPVGKTLYKKRFHFTGQRNDHGQTYLVRNAFFEPTLNRNFDWIGDCINRIHIAFRWGKPAIISTHRVNYTGSINEQNRIKNLKLLSCLLNEIIKRWPRVEFMTTQELGRNIQNRN
jgi:hypothetical protein